MDANKIAARIALAMLPTCGCTAILDFEEAHQWACEEAIAFSPLDPR